MAEDHEVEDWFICPNCLDDDVSVQHYKHRQGMELTCGTCGLQSHKAGDDMEIDIDL